MTYHAARNNQQLGTFEKEDLAARYNRGEILPTDLLWTDGMPAWQPASQILGAPIAPAGSGIPAPATPSPYAPPPLVPPPYPLAPPPVPAAAHYPQNPAALLEECPPDNKTLAIVATVLSVLGCSIISLVLGIVAIVMSGQVRTKYNAGDLAGAKSSAKTSKILSWIAIGILILAIIVGVIIGLSGVMAGLAQRRY